MIFDQHIYWTNVVIVKTITTEEGMRQQVCRVLKQKNIRMCQGTLDKVAVLLHL